MTCVIRSLATIFAALALFACGPSQKDLDQETARARNAERERDEARRAREAADARIQELSNRLSALGQNVEDLEGQRATLQSTVAEQEQALSEYRAREQQARARLATFQNMLQRFRSMIDSGRLRVRVVRNRMVVELPAGVLFDSGQATLKEEGEQTLTEVAAVLREIPDRAFQVAGHTDNQPIRSARFPSNWELSTQRAVNVSKFIMEQGVPAERLSAAGYAETQPASSNDTPEGRQQNRRIEIILMPNLDELPNLRDLETAAPSS